MTIGQQDSGVTVRTPAPFYKKYLLIVFQAGAKFVTSTVGNTVGGLTNTVGGVGMPTYILYSKYTWLLTHSQLVPRLVVSAKRLRERQVVLE